VHQSVERQTTFKTAASTGKYNALMLITFREIQYILQNLFYHNTNTEQGLTPPEVTYHHDCVFREVSKLLFPVSALFFHHRQHCSN